MSSSASSTALIGSAGTVGALDVVSVELITVKQRLRRRLSTCQFEFENVRRCS